MYQKKNPYKFLTYFKYQVRMFNVHRALCTASKWCYQLSETQTGRHNNLLKKYIEIDFRLLLLFLLLLLLLLQLLLLLLLITYVGIM